MLLQLETCALPHHGDIDDHECQESQGLGYSEPPVPSAVLRFEYRFKFRWDVLHLKLRFRGQRLLCTKHVGSSVSSSFQTAGGRHVKHREPTRKSHMQRSTQRVEDLGVRLWSVHEKVSPSSGDWISAIQRKRWAHVVLVTRTAG